MGKRGWPAPEQSKVSCTPSRKPTLMNIDTQVDHRKNGCVEKEKDANPRTEKPNGAIPPTIVPDTWTFFGHLFYRLQRHRPVQLGI